MNDIVERTDIILHGNPNRVLCRLFIPGEEELIRGTSRARELIDRCLALSEEEVEQTLARVLSDFGSRHRHLEHHLLEHYAAVAGLMDHGDGASHARRTLIGAYLTQEYAFESTAYFNPSLTIHPDQSGTGSGELRIIMSVRAVGEGHISSLVFRTGTLHPDGAITIDPPSPFASTRATRFTALRRRILQQAVVDAGLDSAALEFVLGMLPDTFTPEELVSRMSALPHPVPQEDHDAFSTLLHSLSTSSYEVDFDPTTDLSERVLWPTSTDERRGIEDARITRFTDDLGQVIYRASYTGFDGSQVVSRILETADFRAFTSMPMSGTAVRNKGVAFFPRMVDGMYVALSRWDRESNSIAYSADGYHWDDYVTYHVATEPWELIHVGNCGPPLETESGWLVITHGTGPMRRYVISAILLDLDDPTKVLAAYPGPLLVPQEDERSGYVPNVVYSCGGLIYRGTLVLPYGISDCATRIARIDVNELLSRMEPARSRAELV
ncbi:MAG: hypothetical protein RL347_1291 [Actinomycetota bacterium]|jgi:predicted GH43/DUF377 family glycosyl hydrolase